MQGSAMAWLGHMLCYTDFITVLLNSLLYCWIQLLISVNGLVEVLPHISRCTITLVTEKGSCGVGTIDHRQILDKATN